MYYYIYQITNLVNNKIYVGVHQTKDLDDGYMGSGKVIRSAVEKYGVENFRKDILEFFENAELMYAREKEIVNDDFLLREDVYNLRRGGYGGFDHLNDSSQDHIERTKRGYAKSLANLDLSYQGKITAERMKTEKRGIYADDYKSVFSTNRDIQQLGNSPEARLKAKITQKNTFTEIGHQKGDKNSQFGTRWIHNPKLRLCKKIKKDDVNCEGWINGRKMY